MAIIKRVREIKQKVCASEDIQEIKELARRGAKKYAGEEFQTELAARRGIGSPFEVKVKPKLKPSEKGKYVRLHSNRHPTIGKYLVEYKIATKPASTKRWFLTKQEAKAFARNKANVLGVKLVTITIEKQPKKKAPAKKTTTRREAKKPSQAKAEPKRFVKLYTTRSTATKKYRVESKYPGTKLNRRWFESLPEARSFAKKKANSLGVSVRNVQKA